MLIVKSSKLDEDKRNSSEKTSAILYRALGIVEKEVHKRSNKANILSYMKAMFIYEIGKLDCENVLNKSTDSNPTHYLLEKVNIVSILPLSKWDDIIIELLKLDYNQNLNDHEKSTSKGIKTYFRNSLLKYFCVSGSSTGLLDKISLRLAFGFKNVLLRVAKRRVIVS
jgi:hypothetical protein